MSWQYMTYQKDGYSPAVGPYNDAAFNASYDAMETGSHTHGVKDESSYEVEMQKQLQLGENQKMLRKAKAPC